MKSMVFFANFKGLADDNLRDFDLPPKSFHRVVVRIERRLETKPQQEGTDGSASRLIVGFGTIPELNSSR